MIYFKGQTGTMFAIFGKTCLRFSYSKLVALIDIILLLFYRCICISHYIVLVINSHSCPLGVVLVVNIVVVVNPFNISAGPIVWSQKHVPSLNPRTVAMEERGSMIEARVK